MIVGLHSPPVVGADLSHDQAASLSLFLDQCVCGQKQEKTSFFANAFYLGTLKNKSIDLFYWKQLNMSMRKIILFSFLYFKI
jgi:hypothetical protein